MAERPVNSSSVLERLDMVVSREVVGETLLVPIRGDVADMHHIFALNPTAAHIWNAIDGRTPAREIVTSLCEAFEIDKDVAASDLASFVSQLLEAGLVREVK